MPAATTSTAVAPATAAAAAAETSATRHVKPLRILIVEDETIVGMGLRQQLTKLGHTVVGQAATAPEARVAFKDKQPDLVFMDIRLGDADGLELAKELLKERRVPMIVLSAFSDQELINRAGDAGVFGYLIKPASPEALAAQIEVAVQRFGDHERLRLEKEHLAQTLETRKLVEKAKGIFMKRLSLDEAEAHKRLQQESQKRRVGLAELCKKIIESEEILGG
jgi:AmiR/NasT family two-component response regulator